MGRTVLVILTLYAHAVQVQANYGSTCKSLSHESLDDMQRTYLTGITDPDPDQRFVLTCPSSAVERPQSQDTDHLCDATHPYQGQHSINCGIFTEPILMERRIPSKRIKTEKMASPKSDKPLSMELPIVPEATADPSTISRVLTTGDIAIAPGAKPTARLSETTTALPTSANGDILSFTNDGHVESNHFMKSTCYASVAIGLIIPLTLYLGAWMIFML